MALKGDHIRKALADINAAGRQIRSFEDLATGANSALKQAPTGVTVEGAAAFLATMAQESDYFRTTEEYSKNGKYAPYIGRTFQQVTWRNNYIAFGAWCKQRGLLSEANQFVADPKSLADYTWAWLGGVWYFENAKLWRYANAGQFLEVSQGVNNGPRKIGTGVIPNGWEARQKAYKAFLNLGNPLLPSLPGGRLVGNLVVDGVAGPATTRALQALAGTPQDGVISGQPQGIRTTASIGRVLDKHWPTIQYGSGGSLVIAWIQKQCGVKADRFFGQLTVSALQRKLGVSVDGSPGPATVKALQQAINNGKL